MLLDPPRTLPVDNLSVTSLQLYLKCPERWRRRYIDGEREAASPAALVGRAFGGAEAVNYSQKIDTGIDMDADDILDEYADRFQLAVEGESVEWRDEKPGAVKDSGARVLAIYHRVVAPKVRPVAVEREIVARPPDVDWGFRAFLDFEEEDGAVGDHKARGSTKGVVKQAEADSELQPTGYLYGRRAEGDPAPEFRYHSAVRVQRPERKHVAITVTRRSDAALDAFQRLLYNVAAEIQWRLESDVWTGAAPGSWWCSDRYCGFWRTCPYGGLHRSLTSAPPIRMRPATPELRAAAEALP